MIRMTTAGEVGEYVPNVKLDVALEVGDIKTTVSVDADPDCPPLPSQIELRICSGKLACRQRRLR